MGITLVGL